MRLVPENIPQDMKDQQQWAVWKKEVRDGKPAKVPYQADGKRAKSNDASTWRRFETVYMAFQDIGGFDGLCWMMPVEPFDIVFIDIDRCIKNGKIEQWAQKVIEQFNSYTERSQSGNGLHILIRGKKPVKRCRKNGSPYEIYDSLRPCYLTGDVIEGHTTIEGRQEQLDDLFKELFPEEVESARNPSAPKTPPSTQAGLLDDAVILKATLAKNGREFKLLWDGSTLGHNGDESAADLALLNRLAFWTRKDAAQMERLFSQSGLGKRDKWRDRSDYRERSIKTAIADTVEVYEARQEEPKSPTVLDALAALMQNEAEAEKTEKFDRWEWRAYKPFVQIALKRGTLDRKGEEKAHKFLGKFRDALSKFGISYDDLYPLSHTANTNKEEFLPEIKAKAFEILKTGDPVQYLVDSCKRMVLGADSAFKKLACCISVQNINQSAGLHPKMSGESSGGKTWTLNTFTHHLPREMVIRGSMSAKSGFYHHDGDRVIRELDDYQEGNEDLDTTIKQTTSNFHDPYTHRTVANYEATTLTIGKEQTWAITSVDGNQDIQVLNRQLPINVDDSVALTKEVNRRTVERYGKGELSHPIDEAVLVSRCMFQILRDTGYVNVRIPFYERIEWLDVSNRRNPSIFMDLLIAHTAMFRYQREKDAEGYYLATEADYTAARALFTDDDGEELVKRLTARERDVIGLLVMAGQTGMTRDDIAERLKVAPGRVSQIIHGQKGAGGLMQKVQIAETKLSVMIRINEEQSRTVHKVVFSLKEYDHFTGFDGVVRLKPASDERGNASKQAVSNPVSKQTVSNDNSVSTVSKKGKEKEKRDLSHLSSVEDSSSRENEKDTYATYAMATGNETDACGISSEDSPRKLCAKCGADLAGHGTIEKGGKFYCARPGCGYPPREGPA